VKRQQGSSKRQQESPRDRGLLFVRSESLLSARPITGRFARQGEPGNELSSIPITKPESLQAAFPQDAPTLRRSLALGAVIAASRRQRMDWRDWRHLANGDTLDKRTSQEVPLTSPHSCWIPRYGKVHISQRFVRRSATLPKDTASLRRRRRWVGEQDAVRDLPV